MTATYTTSRDEIFGQFLTAWNLYAPSIVGYLPEVRWQDSEKETIPDGSKYWARLSVQTVTEEQTALGECDAPSKRRYTASGLVFVQLFAPKSDSRGAELLGELAMIARNAYRGKSTAGSVWFRNCRIKELPMEDLFYCRNVVCEFEYDDIG